MTYDQIKNFLTIVEQGSFKSAAEQLHKSQPAISVSIKNLEEELGILLFTRDDYRPKLTQAGAAFYQQALKTNESFEELQVLGKELGQGIESQMTLALDAVVPLHFLGPGLQQFFAQKKTQLNLSIEVLEGSYYLLENNLAQLAIAPVLEGHESVQIVPLFTVKMVPVISSLLHQDPLYRDLLKIPQIIVKSSQRESKNDFGIEKGKKWYVTDHSLKAHLIKNSLGWGRLPEHLVADDLKTGKLTSLESATLGLSYVQVGLIKSLKWPLGIVGQQLWEMLKDSEKNGLFKPRAGSEGASQ